MRTRARPWNHPHISQIPFVPGIYSSRRQRRTLEGPKPRAHGFQLRAVFGDLVEHGGLPDHELKTPRRICQSKWQTALRDPIPEIGPLPVFLPTGGPHLLALHESGAL